MASVEQQAPVETSTAMEQLPDRDSEIKTKISSVELIDQADTPAPAEELPGLLTMADYVNYGFADEEINAIRELFAETKANPDNYDTYEKLVTRIEALEGGINRNSSPQSIELLRFVLNKLLAKFPLLFGFWKKYAEHEFNIATPEAAEMVYERGCAHCHNSVDLWASYCGFKMTTCHDAQLVRELFERAAKAVGMDFLSSPFWSKYIEYEERQDAQDKVFAILTRLIQIPQSNFIHDFERFRTMTATRPLSEMVKPADTTAEVKIDTALIDPQTLRTGQPLPPLRSVTSGPISPDGRLITAEQYAQFRVEVEAEAVQYGVQKSEEEIEAAIRIKIDAVFCAVYAQVHAEATKRWYLENAIKRPYFHVTELDNAQLTNWRKYLDFEESEGSFERIVCLYERCLVTCAHYEEFWFRYVRWMSAQPGREEETRNIFRRAVFFVPISRPGIRLQYAYFEEACGNADVARHILVAMLMKLPNSLETITSLANLDRRDGDVEGALAVLRKFVGRDDTDPFTKAALVSAWAWFTARWMGSAETARNVFASQMPYYADSRYFWHQWMDFEFQYPGHWGDEGQQVQAIKYAYEMMNSKSRLASYVKKELGQVYLRFLQQIGGKEAMKEFVAVDRELFGPASISVFKTDAAAAAAEGLDEATRLKAENMFYSFFELQEDPASAPAAGTASYH